MKRKLDYKLQNFPRLGAEALNLTRRISPFSLYPACFSHQTKFQLAAIQFMPESVEGGPQMQPPQ